MSSLLLLTNALQPSTEVLPALGLLLHNVRVAPAEGPALVDGWRALVRSSRELIAPHLPGSSCGRARFARP